MTMPRTKTLIQHRIAGRLAEARTASARGGAVWLDSAEAVELLEMAADACKQESDACTEDLEPNDICVTYDQRVDIWGPLRQLAWQPGPPPKSGLWWVDRGEVGLGPDARYGVIAWYHGRTMCRWVEPEHRDVAVSAGSPWPKWRIAPAVVFALPGCVV